MIRLIRNEISKFSLKKNTPVVLANILNVFMIRNLIICLRIWPCLFKKTQFLLNTKFAMAPKKDPSVVAVT